MDSQGSFRSRIGMHLLPCPLGGLELLSTLNGLKWPPVSPHTASSNWIGENSASLTVDK